MLRGLHHALKMAKRMLTHLRLLEPEAPCETERREGLLCLGRLPFCEHAADVASLKPQLLEQHTSPVDTLKPVQLKSNLLEQPTSPVDTLKPVLLKPNLLKGNLWQKAGATALVLGPW